jgi:NADH dehydrogenase [ubiquinone] 1 alpha subcomplex assembly factor 5
MDTAPVIFDRRRIRRRAWRPGREQPFENFLRVELIDRLVERLGDIRRRFSTVLELGARDRLLWEALEQDRLAGNCHVGLDAVGPDQSDMGETGGRFLTVRADEELLPFRRHGFEAVLAVGGLHLVNDLPGTLAQIRDCLEPDGLFLAAFPGGSSLAELRWALTQAELELTRGAAQRVAPFVDVRDAGALLQRAGFGLPMVDLDRITVTYGEPLELLRDLRAMGESGVLAGRPMPLRRDVLLRARELYRAQFGDDEGRVPATFDILFLTGWAPASSQPKAARRGTGQIDLAAHLARKG